MSLCTTVVRNTAQNGSDISHILHTTVIAQTLSTGQERDHIHNNSAVNHLSVTHT